MKIWYYLNIAPLGLAENVVLKMKRNAITRTYICRQGREKKQVRKECWGSRKRERRRGYGHGDAF